MARYARARIGVLKVPVELYLTNAEAQKIAKTLRDTMPDIAAAIDNQIASQKPKAPLRDVTRKSWSIGGGALFLVLECGHRKTYRGDETTFKARDYKRVRCKQCA